MSSFENLIIEDLHNCNEENLPGIKLKVYYAPESYFHGIVLPTGNTFESFATIAAGDLEFKENKAWSSFECLVDENELKLMLVGPSFKKKFKTQLDLYLLGFKPKVMGFIAAICNEKLILAVEDSNGVFWLIGTKQNPANIDKADGTTGKVIADNSGFSVSVIANTPLYRYAGNILNFNTSGGDFNTDFNKDFFI